MPTLYARLEQFILALSPRSWRFWLVCAVPSLPVFGLFTYTTFWAWRFADRGQQTSGRVMAIGCTGRGDFRYVYAVAGHDFGGQGHPSRVHLDCDALLPGTTVPVFYLPENPALSMAAADPKAVMRRSLIAVVVGTLFAVVGVAGAVYTYPQWPRAWLNGPSDR